MLDMKAVYRPPSYLRGTCHSSRSLPKSVFDKLPVTIKFQLFLAKNKNQVDKTCPFYTSLSSGEAYSDRQLTTNFDV